VRWRKLGERVVYERFRRVVSRTFELPGGETADFEVFELFDSAAVLALTASHEVVLVREFRPGPEEVLLELPGELSSWTSLLSRPPAPSCSMRQVTREI
jgi:ADP-ribose pyrophosphatase